MLKLINAGLARTGTTSLQVALNRLGFGPCYHMFDIATSKERLEQWEQIVCNGQPPDWGAVFEGYTSAADGPPALYYKQINRAFPKAKVILTVRDAERWYQSMHDTLYQFSLKGAEEPPGTMRARMHRLTNTMTWNGVFGGRFSDKEHAIEVFRNHNQAVIDYVGHENLLVYSVKQGWEPLCAFLGVEVPREPFPHVNDTEAMRRILGLVPEPS